MARVKLKASKRASKKSPKHSRPTKGKSTIARPRSLGEEARCRRHQFRDAQFTHTPTLNERIDYQFGPQLKFAIPKVEESGPPVTAEEAAGAIASIERIDEGNEVKKMNTTEGMRVNKSRFGGFEAEDQMQVEVVHDSDEGEDAEYADEQNGGEEDSDQEEADANDADDDSDYQPSRGHRSKAKKNTRRR